MIGREKCRWLRTVSSKVYSLPMNFRQHLQNRIVFRAGCDDFRVASTRPIWRRVMFALHRQGCSRAGRFAFRIAAVLVLTLAFAPIFQPARAQVRIGIGAAGVGAILFNDALSRPQYQNANPEAESKKTVKTKSRKQVKEDTRTAKRSTASNTRAVERPVVTNTLPAIPSPATPSPAATSPTVGASTTADKFGD